MRSATGRSSTPGPRSWPTTAWHTTGRPPSALGPDVVGYVGGDRRVESQRWSVGAREFDDLPGPLLILFRVGTMGQQANGRSFLGEVARR